MPPIATITKPISREVLKQHLLDDELVVTPRVCDRAVECELGVLVQYTTVGSDGRIDVHDRYGKRG